jgi:hypothetical protein
MAAAGYRTRGVRCLLHLTIRPRFVGLAARPRAATLPHTTSWRGLCVWQSWRLLRCSAGVWFPHTGCPCLERGLRSPTLGSWCSTGGTGSAGEAGRRAPQGGFPRRGSRTCHDSPRWCSGLPNTSDTRLGARSGRSAKTPAAKQTHHTTPLTEAGRHSRAANQWKN